MGQVIAGLLQFQIDNEVYRASGNFTYNLGNDKRSALVGPDAVHGFEVSPQVPFIEGEILDDSELDIKTLMAITNATITLIKRNGKAVVLSNAWYASEGNAGTEKSNIPVRFEGLSADEV